MSHHEKYGIFPDRAHKTLRDSDNQVKDSAKTQPQTSNTKNNKKSEKKSAKNKNSKYANLEKLAHNLLDASSLKQLKTDWNGAIGEIFNNRADLFIGAVSDLNGRKEYVRFTTPFKKTHFAMMVHESQNLMRIREENSKDYYAFVDPFSGELWFAIGIALIIVVALMFSLDRVSPYGHHGEYYQRPTIPQLALLEKSAMKLELKEREHAADSMSLANAFYWAYTGLCWQSPECVPRSPSCRIIAIFWYMCGVIFITSYTANLVSCLNQMQKEDRITCFDDLESHLDDVHVGYKSSSIAEYFLSENFPNSKIINKVKNDNTKFKNDSDLMHNLLSREDKKFVIIDESDVLDRTIREYNNKTKYPNFGKFYIPKESRIGRNTFSFVCQKKSKVCDAFSEWMYELDIRRKFEELDLDVPRFEGEERILVDEHNQSLTFNQLGGVFMVLKWAPVLGLVVLIGEWFVACSLDIDKTDPNMPHSLGEAFNLRYSRLMLHVLSQDRTFGKVLFSLFPGKVSTFEFKCQMRIRKFHTDVKARNNYVVNQLAKIHEGSSEVSSTESGMIYSRSRRNSTILQPKSSQDFRSSKIHRRNSILRKRTSILDRKGRKLSDRDSIFDHPGINARRKSLRRGSVVSSNFYNAEPPTADESRGRSKSKKLKSISQRNSISKLAREMSQENLDPIKYSSRTTLKKFRKSVNHLCDNIEKPTNKGPSASRSQSRSRSPPEGVVLIDAKKTHSNESLKDAPVVSSIMMNSDPIENLSKSNFKSSLNSLKTKISNTNIKLTTLVEEDEAERNSNYGFKLKENSSNNSQRSLAGGRRLRSHSSEIDLEDKENMIKILMKPSISDTTGFGGFWGVFRVVAIHRETRDQGREIRDARTGTLKIKIPRSFLYFPHF